MRHYEIVLLIHPDHHDQIAAMKDSYTQLIQSSGGGIHRTEVWDRRALAYPIKKMSKACYVLLNVECDSKTERMLKQKTDFNDAVIRYFSMRRDRAIIEPSVLCVAAEAAKLDADKTASDQAKKRKNRMPCVLKDEEIDYKNVSFLLNFLTDSKKKARRRVTGASARQQNRLSKAIEHARLLGLVPYCDKYAQPEVN